jgi:hypothetical protein
MCRAIDLARCAKTALGSSPTPAMSQRASTVHVAQSLSRALGNRPVPAAAAAAGGHTKLRRHGRRITVGRGKLHAQIPLRSDG